MHSLNVQTGIAVMMFKSCFFRVYIIHDDSFSSKEKSSERKREQPVGDNVAN